ncbi:MAG: MFS transporter, partial [Bradyrhizobium sp.]|uniref:MFS transporter n=1 Tax=Bradyrhizobium sp. TaxID=376 RepID=UPI001A30971C
MVATILASSLAVTVASIITVALPSMQRDLGTDSAGLQWIINAYLLPMSALVLLGGALGDRLGRKRFFILGLAIFALATLGCACAPNLALMLAARFVQGVGAALIVPNSLALLADAYSGKRRGHAVGTWAAASTIAGAAAPLLGGVVVDHADWRWSFAIVVPPAAAALLMGIRSIPSSASPLPRAPLDLTGATLAVIALGNLAISLTYLPQAGALNPVVFGTAGAGFLALAAFVYVERRKQKDAIMPLGIFSSGSFSGISILTLLLYCALGGFMVLLPLFFMNGLGYSATRAGFALLPLPLVMGTLSRPLGDLATRWGVRRTLSLGPVVVAIGFALIATLPGERVSYWLDIFPGLATISLG